MVLWELLRTMLEGGDPSNTPFELCRLQFQYGRAFELILKDVWTPKPHTGTIHHKSALRIAPYARLSTITSSRGQREAVYRWWPQGQRDHPQFRYLQGCFLTVPAAEDATAHSQMGYRVGEALGRVPLLWSKLDFTIETDRHRSEMSALYPYPRRSTCLARDAR